MDFRPDALRKRFHDLGLLREQILARTTPLREARDSILQTAEAQAKVLADEFLRIEHEGGLYDIDQERAVIARALGGKTGTAE